MVYLEYVGKDGDWAVYDYMPEREDAPRGTVSVNTKTLECRLDKEATAGELSWYRGHAWHRIKEMVKDGDLLEHTAVAWY